MVRAAHKRVGEYYYILPHKSQAEKVIWHGTDFKGRQLLDYINPDVINKISQTQRTIYFNNGSTIKMVGTNFDASHLRGTNPIGAIFSEAAWMPKETWTTMRPVFVANKGWMLFQSTPFGRNDFYDLYNNVVAAPDWFVSVKTIEDTHDHKGEPIVDKKVVESDRKTFGMSIEKEEQEYYCKFNTSVSAYYYEHVISEGESDGRLGYYPWDESKPVYAFYDLGVSDATAIWFMQLEGEKKIFIDFYEARKSTLATHIKYIVDKGYNIGAHYLPHDGAKTSIQTNNTTAQTYQDLCYQAGICDYVRIVPRTKVQQGIDAVRNDFKNYHFHMATCSEGIFRLQNYRCKVNPRTAAFENRPLHDNNSHGADALRTQAMAYHSNLVDCEPMPVNRSVNSRIFQNYLIWGGHVY